MGSLTLIIPVEAGDAAPANLVASLREKPDADLEILLVAESAAVAAACDLHALAALDRRARLFIPADKPASSLALWNAAVMEANGDWLSVARGEDGFEPEAGRLADTIRDKVGKLDAIAWNALQISADAEPGKSASVGIPTGFDPFPFEKTNLLKAFFLWEGSINVPKAPFGLFHGMISRTLARTIAETIAASGRQHNLPQWEWSARTILLGDHFVFCPRPLSVIDRKPYQAPALFMHRPDFPFHAGMGVTGAIAEVQHALFAEMGAAWGGSHEHFVRAIIIDCMEEPDPALFNDKCNRYYAGLRAWDGGRHAGLFKPQFVGLRQPDKSRGLHGTTLMIDRHIGGARTALEFYRVVRNFLAPIGLLCGGKAV